jgi:hypothetical protein
MAVPTALKRQRAAAVQAAVYFLPLGYVSKIVICGNMRAWFPSPRPSPVRRGRNIPSVLAKLWLTAAQRVADFTASTIGCSFSPREKVRMRGKTRDGGKWTPVKT